MGLPGPDLLPLAQLTDGYVRLKGFLLPKMQFPQDGLKFRLAAQAVKPPVGSNPFEKSPVLLNVPLYVLDRFLFLSQRSVDLRQRITVQWQDAFVV